MGTSKQFEEALSQFDKANAQDPNLELVEDQSQPAALLYGQRMSRCLERFAPGSSEALQLAVRAQHIQRWAIPRATYPEGIKGYNQWRRAMAVFHAEKAGEILQGLGYEQVQIARVQKLLRKEGRTKDPEAQTLEDVACLVFLEYYFAPFSSKYDDEKLVDIVQKTWRKMSPAAHQAALKLTLPGREQGIVVKALGGGGGAE